MHLCKGSGMMEYDTFEELLQAELDVFTEYDGYYYIAVKPRCFYDNGMYKVDKKTKKLECIYYIQYMVEIADKATPVDPAIFKNAS